MLAPLPAELRSRLERFERAFRLCREGGLSLARLLALPVDRLRLAQLQAGARAVAPVTIAPDAEAHLDAAWPGARTDPELKPPTDPAAVRRFLAFARQDADLDPRAVSSWLEGPADALLAAFTRTQRRGLAEVGRGPGGETTAYLVHLVLLRALRAAQMRSDTTPAQALLVHLVFGLAARGVAESESSEVDALPLRLGLQLALTSSPPALGVEVEALAERAVNGYRTNSAAVALVQRVVREPVESIPLERVIETVARRLVVDPELSRALLLDALLERVRDAALLAFVQTHRTHDLDAAPPLLEVLSSSRALTQTVMVAHRRRALLEWTTDSHRGSRAVQALGELLRSAEVVAGGDGGPLGVSWKLEERAALAARGALLLVLESYVHELVRDLGGAIEEVPDGHTAWEAGAAYRLAFDDAPLHHLPSSDREAIVYVHVGDARALLGSSLAAGVWAQIHAPILEWHARIAGRGISAPPSPQSPRVAASMEVLAVSDEALVFAGPVLEVLELAAAARVVIDRARAAARSVRPDILGGAPESRADAEDEAARIRRRLLELDDAAGRASGPEDAALIADGRAVLVERLAALERAQGPSDPSEPAAGIFVAYGPRARRVSWSGGEVVIGAVLDEARRGARGGLSPLGDAASELEPLLGTSRTEAGGWPPPEASASEGRPRVLSDPMDSAPLRASVPTSEDADRGGAERRAPTAPRGPPDVTSRATGAHPSTPRVTLDVALGAVRLCNRGCALSDAALRAWCRARDGLVELVDELVPGERRIEARRTGSGARVATFRWVGRVAGEDVWELLEPAGLVAPHPEVRVP